KSVIDGIDGGLREQLIAGLSGSARTVFTAALYRQTNRPILVVTHNLYQAQKIYEDLNGLLNEDEVFLYPVNELIASEIGIASPELKGQRIEALNYWNHQSKGIIIAPIAGLKRLLPPKELWKDSQLSFTVGQDIEVSDVLERLIAMGYERVSMVSAPGEYSVRGGILDIYPLTEENPVRIELFDTEVDSIRIFSIEDQRSQGKINSILIGPATEILLSPSHLEKGVQVLEEGLAKSLKKIKDEKVKELLLENISYELEQLRNGQTIEQMFKYLSLVYDQPASLLDYLPAEGIVLIDEISRVQEMAESLDKEEADFVTSLLSQGEIIHNITLSHPFAKLLQ